MFAKLSLKQQGRSLPLCLRECPQPCSMPLPSAGRQLSYSEQNPPHLVFKCCVLAESLHKYWNISQYQQTRQDCTQLRAPSYITCHSGSLFFPHACWPSSATLRQRCCSRVRYHSTLVQKEDFIPWLMWYPLIGLVLYLRVTSVCCHTNGLFTGLMFL